MWKRRTLKAATFVALVLLHFAGATLISMAIGFLPEGTIAGNVYGGASMFGPLPPFMITIACVLGFLVARKWHDRCAVWAWLPGVLWLVLAANDLGWGHGHSSAPYRYLWDNLFTNRCGDTECLYEFFGTVPLVISIAYSLTSWITLRFGRTREGRLENGHHAI